MSFGPFLLSNSLQLVKVARILLIDWQVQKVRLDHASTSIFFCRDQHWINYGCTVCLGWLTCRNIHLLPLFTCLVYEVLFSSNMLPYIAPFIFPSMIHNVPVWHMREATPYDEAQTSVFHCSYGVLGIIRATLLSPWWDGELLPKESYFCSRARLERASLSPCLVRSRGV